MSLVDLEEGVIKILEQARLDRVQLYYETLLEHGNISAIGQLNAKISALTTVLTEIREATQSDDVEALCAKVKSLMAQEKAGVYCPSHRSIEVPVNKQVVGKGVTARRPNASTLMSTLPSRKPAAAPAAATPTAAPTAAAAPTGTGQLPTKLAAAPAAAVAVAPTLPRPIPTLNPTTPAAAASASASTASASTAASKVISPAIIAYATKAYELIARINRELAPNFVKIDTSDRTTILRRLTKFKLEAQMGRIPKVYHEELAKLVDEGMRLKPHEDFPLAFEQAHVASAQKN